MTAQPSSILAPWTRNSLELCAFTPDSDIKQVAAQSTDAPIAPPASTGCATCGRQGGLPPGNYLSGSRCSSCGQGQCAPGHKPCYPCDSHTPFGGFCCDLYACICCPDPCYEPKWLPLQDAAFFSAGARPVAQMRIRWDAARDLLFPDRSEFFWARADGMGKGPRPVTPERRVDYQELNMYSEMAVGSISTFIEYPYLSIDPEVAPHASGFGDLSLGTKTTLCDCELLLVSFQFKTTIPTGDFTRGIGNGHVSLEPSLLFAVKLTHDTYIQGQLSEWIPLGGDPSYAGSIFHSHLSLNHVCCRILPDVLVVGTLEFNTLTFQDGQYTDPVNGPFQQSSGETYVTAGPGFLPDLRSATRHRHGDGLCSDRGSLRRVAFPHGVPLPILTRSRSRARSKREENTSYFA